MIVVIDADYNEDTKKGHVAGILAKTPLDAKESGIVTGIIDHVAEYQPGQCYKRELRCVEEVFRQVKARKLGKIEMILVDGYADFGTAQASLGTHVYDEYRIPVIGIAKNPFRSCVVSNTEVYRGSSEKPLFVTCKGIQHRKAKDIVRKMAGEYRIPALVKLADKVARDWSL